MRRCGSADNALIAINEATTVVMMMLTLLDLLQQNQALRGYLAISDFVHREGLELVSLEMIDPHIDRSYHCKLFAIFDQQLGL